MMLALAFRMSPGIAALVTGSACSAPEEASVRDDFSPARIELARAASAALGSQLRTELVSAMQSGGPVAAVEVCNLRAPEIAHSVMVETDMQVGRTALRVRNLANAPDVWERDQLEGFLAAIEAGADPASLESTNLIETSHGETQLRWMAPIMMDAPCAACHGQSISPEVTAAIAERYPEDAATGFAPGELRGAFTVTMQID